MSVQQGDRGAVLRCHAGCETKDIADALGLRMTELFDAPLTEVARYRYVSRDGEVQFAKVRYFPKTFTIESLHNGSWKPGLNGSAERPLYRLPELLEAIQKGLRVYVVNGEKAADRLWEMGLPATCNFEGESVWKPEYGDYLKGAHVMMVADRDETGLKHAAAVQKDLRGKTASLRIVQSRTTGEHDDIVDHLDAGYGLDELVPLRGSYRSVSLSSVMRAGIPKPVLLGSFLYEGGLHSIAGAPDSGKSTLAMFWALHLLREGRTVLFLDEEGGQEIVAEKFLALGASPDDLQRIIYVPFPGRSWTEDDISSLLELAADTCPALLLVDSSAAFMARAGLDENSASDVTRFWAQVLMPVARQVRTAVLVIDHDTKSTEQSRYARGSGAKLAAIDVQMKVVIVKPFSRDQDGTLRLVVSKDRRGWLHRNWKVEVGTGKGLIIPSFAHDEPGEEETGTPPARRKIYEVLDDQPKGYRQIVDGIHDRHGHYLARATVSTELNELLRLGLVDCMDQPGRETLWSRTRR